MVAKVLTRKRLMLGLSFMVCSFLALRLTSVIHPYIGGYWVLGLPDSEGFRKVLVRDSKLLRPLHDLVERGPAEDIKLRGKLTEEEARSVFRDSLCHPLPTSFQIVETQYRNTMLGDIADRTIVFSIDASNRAEVDPFLTGVKAHATNNADDDFDIRVLDALPFSLAFLGYHFPRGTDHWDIYLETPSAELFVHPDRSLVALKWSIND